MVPRENKTLLMQNFGAQTKSNIDLAKPKSRAPVSNPRKQYSIYGNNYA